MKILQKVNSKILVLLTTMFLAVITLFTGAHVASISKANAAETMTYIDTQVESIGYLQSGKVIMAFRLTVSDYDDHGEVAGEFSDVSSPKYKYLTSLSYWKEFEKMNSKGVAFSQCFAYWNGGLGDSQIGSVGKNAVGHLTTLPRVEYGFLVYFPAGTTFPCLEYFKNNCEGTPVAYRTTEDVAFCYDGKAFVKIDYKVATARMSALEEIKNVDTSKYLQAEQEEVAALVVETEGQLSTCMSLLDVQNVMESFSEALSKIKTVEYYAQLDSKKAQAKQEISTFFNGMTQSAYGEAEWALISSMKKESGSLIDEAMDMDAVDRVVTGIQYKVEEILTEAEKPEFAQFVAVAVKNIQEAFVVTLYREAEATQGAALVEEGKKALEQATTYGEAEALELSYLTKIDALKTAAEWEAEEQENQNTQPKPQPKPEQPQPEPSDKGELSAGCGSSIGGNLVVISLAFMLVVILKNKKRMDI